MTTPFDFSNLDENDPDRASFVTAKEDQERAARAFRGICYKLGYRDEDPLMRNLKPLPDIGQRPSRTALDEEHTEKASPIFQLRGGISDCEIVGMKLNPESLEVSIDWKATLTKFFGRRLAASRIDMLAYDPAWPSEERVEILWERGERRCLINAPNDRATDELQLRFLQDQVRAWRIKCEATLREPRLSAEGLCKRRIADLELNLDDDGRAGRGRSFREGNMDTFDGDGYSQLPRWR